MKQLFDVIVDERFKDDGFSLCKVMADEQKKLHPDCWKRKRSLSSANNQSASGLVQTPNSPLPHSLPHTPNRIAHPFSFLSAAAAHPNMNMTNGINLISTSSTASSLELNSNR